jgi:DNA-binding GntR family transcriptional regulator
MRAATGARKKIHAPKRPAKPIARQAGFIEEIEQDIVSGRIPVNQRLDERALAKRFGVSRTPVRDALNRLVSSGLVEYRPNQGMFTAAISLSQFFQMYELMSHLEGLCALLCARRMSAAEKTRLKDIQRKGDEIAKRGDASLYSEHNLALHDLLYRGSQNEVLQQQVRALRRRLESYRRYSFQLPNRIAESHAEHAQIVDLIVKGNPEGAEAQMRRHMDIQRSNFSDYLMLLSKALPKEL